MTAQSSVVLGRSMWRRLGRALVVIGFGLGTSFAGLAGDFYQHEIAGFSPELESIYAPVHLLIFGGVFIVAFGFLLVLLALRSEGQSPLRMVTA